MKMKKYGQYQYGRNQEDGLDGENSTGRAECYLSKVKKLAVPARVALLQRMNIWVHDLRFSVHCTKGR